MRASVEPMQTIQVAMIGDTTRACAANEDLLYDALGASWPTGAPTHGELGRPIKHERSLVALSTGGSLARFIRGSVVCLPVYP